VLSINDCCIILALKTASWCVNFRINKYWSYFHKCRYNFSDYWCLYWKPLYVLTEVISGKLSCIILYNYLIAIRNSFLTGLHCDECWNFYDMRYKYIPNENCTVDSLIYRLVDNIKCTYKEIGERKKNFFF
jgi:hypothetical protein